MSISHTAYSTHPLDCMAYILSINQTCTMKLLIQFILLIHSCVLSRVITIGPSATTVLPGAGADPTPSSGISDNESFLRLVASSTVILGSEVDPAPSSVINEFSLLQPVASTTVIGGSGVNPTPASSNSENELNSLRGLEDDPASSSGINELSLLQPVTSTTVISGSGVDPTPASSNSENEVNSLPTSGEGSDDSSISPTLYLPYILGVSAIAALAFFLFYLRLWP